MISILTAIELWITNTYRYIYIYITYTGSIEWIWIRSILVETRQNADFSRKKSSLYDFNVEHVMT